ncbi:MAG TPA: hypothetical protein PLJ37_00630 [Chitinophagales bacterium]|nr:hypothetical protein [Chitinophagales bacterium]HMW93456.1 hypothetical protein [Chitinophagales bacterium]HMZ92921.1 hypothetical protein [Chitinophagales bacterium]HNG25890.1 hypothetical protein [Chitinophagales bacterium]
MNLEEILKQLNELEKKDLEDLEVNENWELEIGCRCGSCRELNGLSISTKSITDLYFPFTKIIRMLVERLQEAEEVIHDTLGWADSNPLAIKFGKAYFKKWEINDSRSS